MARGGCGVRKRGEATRAQARSEELRGDRHHLVGGGPRRLGRIVAPLEDASRARLADHKGRPRVVRAHPRRHPRPEGRRLVWLAAMVVPGDGWGGGGGARHGQGGGVVMLAAGRTMRGRS